MLVLALKFSRCERNMWQLLLHCTSLTVDRTSDTQILARCFDTRSCVRGMTPSKRKRRPVRQSCHKVGGEPTTILWLWLTRQCT